MAALDVAEPRKVTVGPEGKWECRESSLAIREITLLFDIPPDRTLL